jgi:tetratricopeptide (TPR) repeat protein
VGLRLAGVLGLGTVGLALRHHPAAPQAEAGKARRRSIAVLGFKNLSGRPETAWLSTALSEMVRTELAAAERVRLVPGESVARMKTDLALADADSFASDTLARIQQNTDADFLVVGSYTALGKDAGGKIRFDVRLQDTHGGELVTAVSESGTETELLELVARTGKRLRDGLHAEAAPAALGRAQASLPENPEAARLYSEGLAALRGFDALKAQTAFEQALAVDASHPMIHSALSQALEDLGYQERAVAEARRAFELAGDLSREERLLVEARYHESAREWDEAIATYRSLFDAFPDNLDYGLRLARAQAWYGRYSDAVAVVAALRRLPAPASEDPRIDLAEAWATPDFRVQERAAIRAAQRGQARGARLLVAEAENSLAMAYICMGRPDDAIAASERARKIWEDMGKDATGMGCYDDIADALAQKGQLKAALTIAEDGVRRALEIGAKGAAAKSLQVVASIYARLGDPATGRAKVEESRRLNEELHDRSHLDADIRFESWALYFGGELVRSEETAARVTALTRGNENVTDHGILNGLILLQRDRLESARESFTQMLQAYQASGIAMKVPLARFDIGMALLEQDRAEEAQSAFREALAAGRTLKSPALDAMISAYLARAAAAQGHDDEATENLRHALALFPRVEPIEARVAVAAAAVLVRGQPADRKLAAGVLADVQRAGLVTFAFNLRLALATRALESGPRGHEELVALEQEAKERGFALIARKAAAQLAEPTEEGEN